MRVPEEVHIHKVDLIFPEIHMVILNSKQCVSVSQVKSKNCSLDLHCPWLYVGSPQEERHTDVKVIRHRLALD